MDRIEILRRLDEDLQKAREWRASASAHFDEVTRGIPSGVPFPDNVARINFASKQYTHSLEAVSEALKRRNYFLIHERLPESAPSKRDEPFPETRGLGDS